MCIFVVLKIYSNQSKNEITNAYSYAIFNANIIMNNTFAVKLTVVLTVSSARKLCIENCLGVRQTWVRVCKSPRLLG